MLSTDRTDRFEKLIIFIVSLLIFAVTFIIYGYRLVPDSGGYIAMLATGREMLYPFFLFIFRSIFKIFNLPDDAYLYAASAFTNFLAAYAVYFATINIKRLFNQSKIITVLIGLIFISPFYLTIIFSITGVVTSCSIWTESLTLPLYYIYFSLLLRFVLNHDYKDYIKSIILAIALSLTRGQMAVLFIVNLIAGVIAYKIYFKPVLIMLASFIIVSLLSRSYFYIKTGRFIGNTYGPITMSSGVLLAGSEADADLFNDPDIKDLYINITREITKQGYRDNLYNSGLLNTGYRAEFAHDNVKFHISGPLIYNYVIEKQGVSGLDAEIARDKIAANIMRTLLKSPDVIKNYLNIWAGYCTVGFIRSVAFEHPVLNIYAAFIYILAVILLILSIKMRFKREALFMFMALLALTGFVTGVSLVIMPLSRYVIYNLPFIYAAIIVCGLRIINKNKYGRD